MKIGTCVEKESVNSGLHYISDSTKMGYDLRKKKDSGVVYALGRY